jgi:hypothetical protein
MSMDDAMAGQPTRHLDARTWEALQADPKADPALFEHVASGCEQCDAVISSCVEPLDGALDAALLSLAPPSGEALDELGWMRLRKQLKPAQPTRGGQPFFIVFALAATLALTAGAVFTSGSGSLHRGPDGLKGSSTTGPQLQLSAARKRGAADSFVRLDDGAQLEQGSVLVFQATSSIEGPARVFLQRAGAPPSEVGQTALEAGTHELQTETGILGVSLDGERGAVTVWVVVGEGPFSASDALRAIERHGSAALGVARVNVRVE